MTQIINYSEKAIAVVGDTKAIKEQLKALGGKFNKYLKCGAGWVFAASKRAEVERFIMGEKPEKNASIKDWRIYVGTYAKYNRGSLAGAWLNLADYANKDEFLAACRELHKDERDPELMFQDSENVPSWLLGESFVDAEIWDYKPEQIAEKQTTEAKAAIIRKYLNVADKSWYGLSGEQIITGMAKQSYLVFEVEGRWYRVEKSNIETKFCHPDEPAESVAAWWKICRTYEYFERENLDAYQRIIDRLNDKSCYIGQSSGITLLDGECYAAIPCWGRKEGYVADMDDKTRKALVKAYKTAIELHRKRLQTWWKKYGADKLHCWTYWADR